VVTGIEPTTSSLLDKRLSRSDNQASLKIEIKSVLSKIFFEIDFRDLTARSPRKLFSSGMVYLREKYRR